MTTLKYLAENPLLTEDGADFFDVIYNFYSEGDEHEYRVEDGTESLVIAFEEFGRMIFPEPPRSFDGRQREKFGTVRDAVLTLMYPKNMQGWQLAEIKEALRTDLTKEQIVDAFTKFAVLANEYFRLRWIVAEHGGWRKESEVSK